MKQMASTFVGVILFHCLILVAHTEDTNEWASKALEIEHELNQVKASQATDQGRMMTMAQVFSNQVTKLNNDVSAAKTVLNKLLEDTVTTQGKMGELQGMNADVHNVQAQLNRFHHNLSSLVTMVQHSVRELDSKFQDETGTQHGVNSQHSEEMLSLQNRINALVDKNAAQEAKTAQLKDMMEKLNQTVTHASTSGTAEAVSGTVGELQQTIHAFRARQDATDDRVNSQLLALRNLIENLKKEIKNRALYPFQ